VAAVVASIIGHSGRSSACRRAAQAAASCPPRPSRGPQG
jgi:hypothetical protein